MNSCPYIIYLSSGQAQPVGLSSVEVRSPDNLIDEFRRSPRGDLRAVAALATIALETSPSIEADEGAP